MLNVKETNFLINLEGMELIFCKDDNSKENRLLLTRDFFTRASRDLLINKDQGKTFRRVKNFFNTRVVALNAIPAIKNDEVNDFFQLSFDDSRPKEFRFDNKEEARFYFEAIYSFARAFAEGILFVDVNGGKLNTPVEPQRYYQSETPNALSQIVFNANYHYTKDILEFYFFDDNRDQVFLFTIKDTRSVEEIRLDPDRTTVSFWQKNMSKTEKSMVYKQCYCFGKSLLSKFLARYFMKFLEDIWYKENKKNSDNFRQISFIY